MEEAEEQLRRLLAEETRFEEFRELVEGAPHLLSQSVSKRPVLHVLISRGKMRECLYAVDEQGADLAVRDAQGRGVLHAALRAEAVVLGYELLLRGAPSEVADRHNETVLHLLAGLSNVGSHAVAVHMVGDVLVRLAPTARQALLQQKRTRDGYTALMAAVEARNERMAAQLLRHGAPSTAATRALAKPMGSKVLDALFATAPDESDLHPEQNPADELNAEETRRGVAQAYVAEVVLGGPGRLSEARTFFMAHSAYLSAEQLCESVLQLYADAQATARDMPRRLMHVRGALLELMGCLSATTFPADVLEEAAELAEQHHDRELAQRVEAVQAQQAPSESLRAWQTVFQEGVPKESAATSEDAASEKEKEKDKEKDKETNKDRETWGGGDSEERKSDADSETSSTLSGLDYPSPSPEGSARAKWRECAENLHRADVAEVATELTRAYVHLVREVEPADLVSSSSSSRLPRLSEHYNRLNYGVLRALAGAQGHKEGVELVGRAVALALAFAERHNFLAVGAVVGALDHYLVANALAPYIAQYASSDDSTLARLEAARLSVSPLRNFAAYRKAVAAAPCPYVPFVPLILRKLDRGKEMTRPWDDGKPDGSYIAAMADVYGDLRAATSNPTTPPSNWSSEFLQNGVDSSAISRASLILASKPLSTDALSSVAAQYVRWQHRSHSKSSHKNSGGVGGLGGGGGGSTSKYLMVTRTSSGEDMHSTSSHGHQGMGGAGLASSLDSLAQMRRSSDGGILPTMLRSRKLSVRLAGSSERAGHSSGLPDLSATLQVLAFESQGILSVGRARQWVVPSAVAETLPRLATVAGLWSYLRSEKLYAWAWYAMGLHAGGDPRSPSDIQASADLLQRLVSHAGLGAMHMLAWHPSEVRLAWLPPTSNDHEARALAPLWAHFVVGVWTAWTAPPPPSSSEASSSSSSLSSWTSQVVAALYAADSATLLVLGGAPDLGERLPLWLPSQWSDLDELFSMGIALKVQLPPSQKSSSAQPGSPSSASAGGIRAHHSGSACRTPRAAAAPTAAATRVAQLFESPVAAYVEGPHVTVGHPHRGAYLLCGVEALSLGWARLGRRLGASTVRVENARLTATYLLGEDVGQALWLHSAAPLTTAGSKTAAPVEGLKELLTRLVALLAKCGLGKLEDEEDDADSAVQVAPLRLRLRLRNSPEALAWMNQRDCHSTPVCSLACGLIAGYMQAALANTALKHLFPESDLRLLASEISCKACSSNLPYCEILLAPFPSKSIP